MDHCGNTTIPVNTDVGGPGIIISFTLTAWITNFIALIPAWTALRSSILRFYPRAEYWGMFPPSPSRVTLKAMKQILYGLYDLQLFTGLSIIIAGFVSLDSLTYYHQTMIMNFWWLTLHSFWIARVELDVFNERSAEGNSKLRASSITVDSQFTDISSQEDSLSVGNSPGSVFRSLAILTSVVLGTTYQAKIYFAQSAGWDWEDGTKCFIYHDTSDPRTTYVWIAGLALYSITLALAIIPFCRGYVPRWLNWQIKSTESLYRKCQGLIRPQSVQITQESQTLIWLQWTLRYIVATLTCVFLILFWLIQQFFAIWSFGNGWYPMLLALFFGSAGWTTYDIIDQKISNLNLMDSSENQWSFGQVLPVILLLAICSECLDVFHDKALSDH